jgi:cell wall-associated NlpC family hydrolase
MLAGCGSGQERANAPAVSPPKQSAEVDLDPTLVARERAKTKSREPAVRSRAQVVNAVPPGQAAAEDEPVRPSRRSESARAQTDAEIRRDLRLFQRYLATIPPTTGKVARVISSGEAAAPFDAPPMVIQIVQAANQIARTPYRWGGGHSAWRDKGYDCSGSISFALASVGLLSAPLDSTSFMSYGAKGPGKWVTIYANGGHAWMTVAGLRFDTSGLRSGSRWVAAPRSTAGFVARHPPGL